MHKLVESRIFFAVTAGAFFLAMGLNSVYGTRTAGPSLMFAQPEVLVADEGGPGLPICIPCQGTSNLPTTVATVRGATQLPVLVADEGGPALPICIPCQGTSDLPNTVSTAYGPAQLPVLVADEGGPALPICIPCQGVSDLPNALATDASTSLAQQPVLVADEGGPALPICIPCTGGQSTPSVSVVAENAPPLKQVNGVA